VFTDVIHTPPRIFPGGFKWGFIRKRNENNEVVRYGSLDSDIYMKVPDRIFVPNTNANRNMYYVKPLSSLYMALNNQEEYGTTD
jgi:hypothetical protein